MIEQARIDCAEGYKEGYYDGLRFALDAVLSASTTASAPAVAPVGSYAERYAEALETKFNTASIAEYQAKGKTYYYQYKFWVEKGQKFDRIVYQSGMADPARGEEMKAYQTFVHAFVEKATGALVKADGYRKPAKWAGGTILASKYNLATDFDSTVAIADSSGGYLYQ